MQSFEHSAEFQHLTDEVFTAFARQDRASLETLAARGFRTTGGRSGNRMGRDEWINLIDSGFVLRSFTLGDIATTIDGDTVVASYEYSQDAAYNGQQSPRDWFISDVWVRRGKAWQLLARHYEVASDN